MTAPWEAFRLFLLALGLGAVAGVIYSFLRPLRPRFTALADLLFLAGLYYLWLEHSFRFCRGDIRLWNGLGILLGAWGFDRLLGRRLLPFFSGFWKLVRSIFRILLWPGKIFMEFLRKIRNFLLLKIQKMFTIKKLGSVAPEQRTAVNL